MREITMMGGVSRTTPRLFYEFVFPVTELVLFSRYLQRTISMKCL